MTANLVPLPPNQAQNPNLPPCVLLFYLEFKLSFQVSDITLFFTAVQAEVIGMK